jgi:uncharacterized phage-associated protein
VSPTPSTTTYDARAVANYFLDLAERDGKPVTPMGIEKLVYFAHGWRLGVYGIPLIKQRIETFRYGPSIRDLANEFQRFGNGPITSPASVYERGPDGAFTPTLPRISKSQDPATAQLLDQVWATYGDFTAIQLSNITHEPGAPWSQALDKNQPFIDDELIKKYFAAQAQSNVSRTTTT